MPPRRLKPTLGEQTVLVNFACRSFGFRSIREMLLRMARPAVPPGPAEDAWRDALQVSPEWGMKAAPGLELYDRNIRDLSRRLRMTEEHGRRLQPHQYLALLLTEHYLDRYFRDPEDLAADLNLFRERHCKVGLRPAPYQVSELGTLAFQSATGSGKTLLLHAHIEQYRRYAKRAGRRINAVILLTPNERMSEQHLRELAASGIEARLFSADSSRDIFAPVEVFDLNKLAEQKGVKRIAVSAFGENNLVLVDEGHLGASGKAWRERRAELARGGFTFEYSATFDQIVGKEDALRESYAKCLLFDYPYRDFHRDGYGKDYSIVNLPEGAEDENSDLYLLGCLLTFYRQLRLWKDRGVEWRAFHPARPLWAFLGKTVLGKSKVAERTRSDVVLILEFLGRFLARRSEMEHGIGLLLAGKSGLAGESGADWFAARLGALACRDPQRLYADVCETVFYGRGRLHVEYLTTGEGELHLRVADGPVFGVVNVGDAAGLYQRLRERPENPFRVEKNAGFSPRLFPDVDLETSPVNMVVGARRFIAGWNSWRVSTMGLMHVGVGEGPEIVQMFGRGVRLRGWKMGLKRHGAVPDVSLAETGEELSELETLHIFGLRANYMATFRELMQKEGLQFETETVRVPVTWNFGRVPDLKILRARPGRGYGFCAERPPVPDPAAEHHPVVRRDLYSRLEIEASRKGASGPGSPRQFGTLEALAPLFDENRIYERVLARKGEGEWRNLGVERGLVRQLLETADWYDLYIPPARLAVTSFEELARLEELAADLIAEYLERAWRQARRRWEQERLEVVPLDENDPNSIEAHEVSGVGVAELVRDLHGLTGRAREKALWDLGLLEICTKAHAYEPLLQIRERKVEIRPVPLDTNEANVVRGLQKLAESGDPCLDGRALFLIRNLTRGRGVSFFDDFAYYPDFIVWLHNDDSQHVLFLDPKGLGRYGPREQEKVRLHREIKTVEARVQEQDPALFLHAYVLSNTRAEEIAEGRRSASEWKKAGVYFLDQENSLAELIADALGG